MSFDLTDLDSARSCCCCCSPEQPLPPLGLGRNHLDQARQAGRQVAEVCWRVRSQPDRYTSLDRVTRYSDNYVGTWHTVSLQFACASNCLPFSHQPTFHLGRSCGHRPGGVAPPNPALLPSCPSPSGSVDDHGMASLIPDPSLPRWVTL